MSSGTKATPITCGVALAILMIAYGLPSPSVAEKPSGTEQSGGETNWRWIGIRKPSDTRCPTPPTSTGWTTEQLFGDSENHELERFCVYSSTGDANPAVLTALPLVGLDRDVMGVDGQGSTLADTTWTALEAHFLAQAGQVALPAAQTPGVRLAIVDASPTGTAVGATGPEDKQASSPHGTALLNMARDLVCDPAELVCRATVASRLAMAYECFDPEAPRACRNGQDGGYIGLIGELAQTIRREVEVWKASPQRHLVLNLSLGWHQRLGGGETSIGDMPSPVQATYRAIEDAVCHGALVIAAAGNRGAGQQPSGPFLPARWETRPAASTKACRDLGVEPPLSTHFTRQHRKAGAAARYRPLLFSVAGVEASGAPLATTRSGGIARLAAYSDHAVVGFSGRPGPTGTLTGSSVAALVVSATAAAAWSYLPGAAASDVMATVYATGSPLGRDADYCLGGVPCPPAEAKVRRVSLCQVVAKACALSGFCSPPACPAPTPVELATADLTAFDTVAAADLEKLTAELAPVPACGDQTIFYDGSKPLPDDLCPHLAFDGRQFEPWAEPQPESIPCPNCIGNFASPGTFYFEVDTAWRGVLESATLNCGDTSYALGLDPLTPGDRMRLDQVPVACLDAFPTFLSFRHGQDRGVIVPILRCQGCR